MISYYIGLDKDFIDTAYTKPSSFLDSLTFIAIYHINTANTVAPQTLPTMYERVSSSSQWLPQSSVVVEDSVASVVVGLSIMDNFAFWPIEHKCNIWDNKDFNKLGITNYPHF